jgi:hypothetical protein
VSAHPEVVGPGAAVHDLPRLDCHDLRLALQLGILEAWSLRPYLGLRRTLRSVRRGAGSIAGRFSAK